MKKISGQIIAQNPHQIKVFTPPESPQNLEELIEKLLQCPHLKGWERLFVREMQGKRLGSRQREKLEAIATRLGVSEGGEA